MRVRSAKSIFFITFLLIYHNSDLWANGFYMGGATDVNIAYPGGLLLKHYFKYWHASDIKKTIVPGYDVYLLTGATFFTKDKSSLAFETGLGNSMIDYSIKWRINTNSNPLDLFKQRWNQGINWYFGFKYSYANISLTVAPLFLFKINYRETSYAESNGRALGYSVKRIINYGDYIFGQDNESKLDLLIRVDYRIELKRRVELHPFIVFQPALLYDDSYDFGPSAKTADASIFCFGAGLFMVYDFKARRR